MQQYFTLEEAASKLMLSPDELRQMAKSKKIRAFQDKGSWRFRTQDVEEEARKRGVGSDPEVQVGEAPASSKPPSSKRPSKLVKQKPADEDAAVDFNLEDKPSGGPKSSGKSGPKSPKPKTGSDSDVRLVMDSDQDFQIDEVPSKTPSSIPKPPSSMPKPAASSASKPPSTSPTKGRKSKVQSSDSGVKLTGDKPSDSDVKVVPAANDSDVKPKPSKSPSDSDIRLQDAADSGGGKKKKGESNVVTEEIIDLDAEEEKLSKSQLKPGTKSKVGPKPSSPSLPTSSPFELSEDDLNLDEGARPKPPSGKVKKPGSKKSKLKKDEDSSSDFELIPFDSAKSPVELGSGEIPLLAGDEDVDLGTMGDLAKGAGNSGINLDEPTDSGISLEEGGSDEVEFELTLDSGASPKPAPAPTQDDDEEVAAVSAEDSSSEFELSVGDESSSEFELSLDDDAPSDPSSSEFELSLDDSGETAGLDDSDSGSDSGSDSEFELTLDDEGDLAVDEDAGEVFEPTNFDVPSLDEDGESASEAVAIDEADTDLDGSDDFEISLDDDSDSDSESQVVALEDEEEADADGPTVAQPRKAAAKMGKKDRKSAPVVVVEDEDEGSLDFDLADSAPARKKAKKSAKVVDEDEDEDEEEEEEEKAAAVAAPPPEWGVLPALMLMPAVIVLFLVGIMGFELIQSQYGYQRPAKGSKPMVDWIARPVADAMDAPLPKE